jgi:hypothetical protein
MEHFVDSAEVPLPGWQGFTSREVELLVEATKGTLLEPWAC